MGDPRRLRPDEVEIFVARELRKAGLALSRLAVRGRTELSKQGDEYAVELAGSLRVEGADREVLIECRNERQPVGADTVRTLHAKLAAEGERGTDEDEGAPRSLMQPPAPRVPRPPKPRAPEHALMFSTSGYEPDAVRAARAAGVALLTVADGKTAFARSPWGMAGEPPAWIPEYMAEVVELDAAGRLRHELIVADRPGMILERLKPNGE